MSFDDDYLKAVAAAQALETARELRWDARAHVLGVLLGALPTLIYYGVTLRNGDTIRGTTIGFWDLFWRYVTEPDPWGLFVYAVVFFLPAAFGVRAVGRAHGSYREASNLVFHAKILTGEKPRNWTFIVSAVLAALLAPLGVLVAAMINKGWFDWQDVSLMIGRVAEAALALW